MHRATRPLATLCLILSVAGPARAWGPQGHRVITRAAMSRLTPAASKAIHDLLLEGDNLVDLSDWADHDGHDAVPGSAPWHYVNVPLSASKYEDRYCGPKGCVVSQIKHFRKVLADRNAPKRERQRALLFLVHFVEDVHQPMHVGDNRDQGGNLTQIQFLDEGTNLHRLWDSGLIHRIGGNDRAWTDRVERRITADSVKAWSKGTVEDWATESLLAARKAYLDGSIKPGAKLGQDYQDMALPIARQRLAQSATRLAMVLNEVFP
jgi:hypothetical protein